MLDINGKVALCRVEEKKMTDEDTNKPEAPPGMPPMPPMPPMPEAPPAPPGICLLYTSDAADE